MKPRPIQAARNLVYRIRYAWHVRRLKRAIVVVAALMHLIPRKSRRQFARELASGRADVVDLIERVRS